MSSVKSKKVFTGRLMSEETKKKTLESSICHNLCQWEKNAKFAKNLKTKGHNNGPCTRQQVGTITRLVVHRIS